MTIQIEQQSMTIAKPQACGLRGVLTVGNF
jgi:hypothetical protein